MRRFVIALVLAAAFVLSGCSEVDGLSENDETADIVCSLFPMYDIVRQISGDRVSVSALAPSGTDGHSYEPLPMDIIAISKCKLFIYIGGESEVWVDSVLKSLGKDAPRTLKLIECAGESLIEEEHEGHDHDSDELYDEHIWTSPEIYKIMVEHISEELCDIFPDDADFILSQTDLYVEEVDLLDAEFREISENAQIHTLVFGDRFPFKYLAEECGFDYIAAFEGCGEDTEPSAGAVAEIIDYVKMNNVGIIFCMSDSSQKIAETIAKETGAEISLLHSCHTLTAKEKSDGETYISLMKDNAEKIRQAVGAVTENGELE